MAMPIIQNNITLNDCALLAEDVYSETGDLGRTAGWEIVAGQCWDKGFAGAIYRRNGQIIVSFRGTDDMNDALLADVLMLPKIDGAKARNVVKDLLGSYGFKNGDEIHWLPALVGMIYSQRDVQSAIAKYCNTLPTGQGKKAIEYVRFCSEKIGKPYCVVGHSLGGALAQYTSFSKGTPAVSFNGPYVGGLRGSIPMTSTRILHINAVLDPLSMATRAAGELPNGREIAVNLPDPPRSRPTRPKANSLLQWIEAMILPAFYFAGKVVDEMKYQKSALEYLEVASLHYHNMSNLRASLKGGANGSKVLAACIDCK